MVDSKPTNYDSVCQTRMLKYSLSQKWIIHDFADLADSSEPDKLLLHSNPFSHQSDPETRWRMQMYPAGETKDGEDPPANPVYSLYVNVTSKTPKTARFEFFYVKPNGKACSMHGTPVGTRRKWNQFAPNGGFGLRNNARSIALANLHLDGSLHLKCEVGVKNAKEVACLGTVVVVDDSATMASCRKIQLINLANSLDHVLDTGMYSDFTIVVGKERIAVHKNILASQSEVFRTMFEGTFSENDDNEMTITDSSPAVVMHFLKFLYGQSPLQGFSEVAGELLVLGEKYEVTALKLVAERELCRLLDTDSVCQTIILAHLNRAIQLERQCIQFILKNKLVIMKKPEWFRLRKEHSQLVLRIMDADWGAQE